MSIGSFVSGIFGSENKATAQTPPIDEERGYEYGGHFGGADEAANRYRQTGEAAQGREAAQANYGAAINAGLVPGMQARGDMNTVGQAQLARALGKVPSVAEQVGARQTQGAIAAQASQAAGARGAAGLALAGQTAANNTANATSAIANQTQINAGAERAAAEAAAAGTFNGLQSQDAQRMGQLAQMSQYQATNQMQQKELNDRMQLGMTGFETGVRGMQLGAAQNREAQYSSNYLGAAGINAGVGGQNAAMNQSNAYGVVGLGAQVAGGYAGGGAVTGGKADGGPVKAGKTYLTGERGPEMVVDLDDPAQVNGVDLDEDERQAKAAQPYIVGANGPELHTPPRDAVVIPSEITVPMLAQSTWGTGRGDEIAQSNAALDAEHNQRRAAEMNQTAAQPSPWEKQVHDTGVLQRRGLANEEDIDSAKRSRQVLRDARGSQAVPEDKEEAKADPKERETVAEGKAVPKRGKLASALGTISNGAQRMAGNIDTAYHGPTQVSGPNLIPVSIPGRAMGGPVQAGNPYMMGERGPEMVMPSFKAINAGGPANPSANALGGGGMDVLGSLRANSAFATQYQRDPTGGMVAGAREEGGPVDAGKKYLVGEKGPEAVVPAGLTPEQRDIYGALSGPRPASNVNDTLLYRKASAPVVAERAERPDLSQAKPDTQKEQRGVVDAGRDVLTAAQQTTAPAIVPLGSFLARLFGGR